MGPSGADLVVAPGMGRPGSEQERDHRQGESNL